ncbi:Hypothetical protein SRAE_1000154800 [Strongyloides ratti]|uniref:Uncharacterized protein n=1 Tax=Strongyloides ratti TaxID=34506 RepID=A0A090L0J6_STRRB|nr:Hypothetical protein SRAE_1000154800 [Strongyloides ratti]CEF63285.1 Hypothetical protein SRAE_1000154800 [Strongyloides ratti]
MNSLSSVKNIFKNIYFFKSNVLYSRKLSTGTHNYTLRVDIKNPSEADKQNFKSLDRKTQNSPDDKMTNETMKKEIYKPFGTDEYNYTLTSAPSFNENSSIKSKRI